MLFAGGWGDHYRTSTTSDIKFATVRGGASVVSLSGGMPGKTSVNYHPCSRDPKT